MRIAYFTNDLEFAKRFSMLLGKNDTDMIFEIIDVKSQILGLGDCELDIENYDLIVGDVGISADDLRFDLLISQDDKLLTLCEHYNNLVAAYRRKRGIQSMKPYGGQAKYCIFVVAVEEAEKLRLHLVLRMSFADFTIKKSCIFAWNRLAEAISILRCSIGKRIWMSICTCCFQKRKLICLTS